MGMPRIFLQEKVGDVQLIEFSADEFVKDMRKSWIYFDSFFSGKGWPD
jgi:hypothetical protein